MDYEFKANLTTVLSFVLLPVLAGLGVDAVTGAAVVGLIATICFYALLYYGEKFTSRFFTQERPSAECNCVEDAVNPEYYTDEDEAQ